MIHLCYCTGGPASTLAMSRKQEAMASCEGCGGEPLANGSESLLGSVHGNVGLKLTSLINSGLTWEKVAKGNRTSSRRARNTVSRSLKAGGKLINKDSSIVDMTVSESEKLGVSVLGCRFSEKAEHVPIKKRRFMFRSPSPPHRGLSLCCEETQIQPEAVDCTASTSDLGQIDDTENDIDDKNIVRVKKQLDENDDFSGISLLAATACSTSFGGGGDHVEQGSGVEGSLMHEGPSMNNETCSLLKRVPKEDLSSAEISTEGTGSSVSGLHAEELAGSLRMDNSSTNSVSLASKEHNESVQDHAGVILEDVLTEKVEGAEGVHGFSSRDRLHWDLNTSMDAWERPFDDQCADSHVDVADGTFEVVKHDCVTGMRSIEDEAVQGEPGGSSCHVEKDQLPTECSGMAHKEQISQIEEFRSHSCTNTDNASSGCAGFVLADTACASTDSDKSALAHGLTFGSSGNSESLLSHQVVGLDSCINNPDATKTSHCLSTCVPETAVCDLVSPDLKSMQTSFGCEGEIVTTDAQVKEKINPLVTSSDNTICGTQCALNEGADNTDEGSDIPGNSNSQPLKSELVGDVGASSLCQSNGVELSPSCPTVPEMAASAVPALDSKVEHDNIDRNDIDNNVSPEEIEEPFTKLPDISVELLHSPLGFSSCKPCRNNSEDLVNSSDKIDLEEPLENGYDSDVSHDEASVKCIRSEVDYDSQYEDGEVRGSIEHTWEEYDGEDMEVEHVDYGFDNVNLGSEAEQIMMNAEGADFQPSQSSLKGKDVSSDVETANDIHNNIKAEPDEGIRDSELGAGEDDARINNDSNRKNINDDSTIGLDTKKQTRVVELRAFRRGLRSCIEGRTYHDVSFRKDSDADESNPRSEWEPGYVESFGRGRYTQHAYARGRGGDCRVDYRDNKRGIKCHHSPNYHGSVPFRHHEPEENIVHRRLTRCRSPHAREEAFAMRMHIRASRDWSPGRRVTLGRGRSVRYGLRVDDRGLRGRYNGSVPDDCTEAPLKHPYPSVKRDRSFSPIERRDGKHSYPSVKRERSFSPIERRDPPLHRFNSKFSSRSGSRSPNSGNPSFRRDHQSKSPNCRTETRMPRRRSPHLQPGVLSDRMAGHRPIQRCYGSPPRNTRWIGDRKDGVSHFREQGYNQRSSFRDRGSPVRFGQRADRFGMVDSPRSFRSMHTARFAEMDGGVGRGGLRREGSDDTVRFAEMDGGAGRGGLRYEGSDDTGRLTEMDGGVGRGGLRYEGNDDPGKFTEMDGGAGRGGIRYEGSDDNKGKHGYRLRLVHPVKRYDMDGPVKRFGYNVEGSFVSARGDDDKGKHGYRFGVVHPVKRYDMDGPVKRFRCKVEDNFVAARNSRYRGAPEFHGRASPKDHSRGY